VSRNVLCGIASVRGYAARSAACSYLWPFGLATFYDGRARSALDRNASCQSWITRSVGRRKRNRGRIIGLEMLSAPAYRFAFPDQLSHCLIVPFSKGSSPNVAVQIAMLCLHPSRRSAIFERDDPGSGSIVPSQFCPYIKYHFLAVITRAAQRRSRGRVRPLGRSGRAWRPRRALSVA
jgi:hypothetical protein